MFTPHDQVAPEDKVFYRRETPAGFEFLPARIAGVSDGGITVQLDGLELTPGDQVTLYFELGEEFLAQPWAVGPQRPDTPTHEVWLAPEGKPTIGCQRESTRVSTVFEGISARFGGEADCVVTDISDEGLAIRCDGAVAIDTTQPLQLSFHQMVLNGHVKVRSVLAAQEGQFRYGLHCEADRIEDGEDLRRMLPKIATALQVKRLELTSWPSC